MAFGITPNLFGTGPGVPLGTPMPGNSNAGSGFQNISTYNASSYGGGGGLSGGSSFAGGSNSFPGGGGGVSVQSLLSQADSVGGIPQDPRVSGLIDRLSALGNRSDDDIASRVDALMAPQQAIIDRDINRQVTRSLAANGLLPTGGSAAQFRSEISAPIYERLANARAQAARGYEQERLSVNQGLLGTLNDMQQNAEVARNQRAQLGLGVQDLGMKTQDLAFRREEAARQAQQQQFEQQFRIEDARRQAEFQAQEAQRRAQESAGNNALLMAQLEQMRRSMLQGQTAPTSVTGSPAQGTAYGQIGGLQTSGPTSSSQIRNVQQEAARLAGLAAVQRQTELGRTQLSATNFNPSDPFGITASLGATSSVILAGDY